MTLSPEAAAALLPASLLPAALLPAALLSAFFWLPQAVSRDSPSSAAAKNTFFFIMSYLPEILFCLITRNLRENKLFRQRARLSACRAIHKKLS